MKSKLGALTLILIATLMTFASCTKDQNVENNANANYHVRITKVASSTSGITLSWVDDKGDNINYTVKVYNDAECKDLYQSYTLAFKAGESMRFTVPYLSSDKKYYICVVNISGSHSKPFEVSLTEPTIRRNIFSQNFDKLFWGYDYVNLAHSVVTNDNPATYIIDNFEEAIAHSKVTSKIDETGGLLFKYKSTMLELMGFKGWDKEKNKNVRILPGYVKLGTQSEMGVLCTPTFSELGDETVTAIISFDACVYASSLNASGGQIKVSIYKGNDTTPLATKNFSLTGVTGKPSWNHCPKFEVQGVTKDCYCKIETTTATKQVCVDNLQIVQYYKIPENHIYGYVTDMETSEPIEGVVVSDGFEITTTDEYGMYLLPRNRDAKLVYYSTPAEYEMSVRNYQPAFYSKIKGDNNEYNFSLKKLPGGKEQKFALFTFADPQVSTSDKLKRLQDEFVPAVKAHSSTLDIPCYGITLGDIISNGNDSNTTPYMQSVRDYMRTDVIGMPVFHVMGNHDCNFFNDTNPLPSDGSEGEYTNSHKEQIKAQSEFENVLGPVNYSFNRGDVHIVAMRDILYASNTNQSGYSKGFTKEQYEWLVEDLSYVSRDKMVVLCVHIPLYNIATNSGEDGHYIQEVHELLNEFNEAHILSGHMHTHTNYQHEDYNIYEHNQASVCGAWWLSNITGDGVPNGYGVFIGDGNTFSDWYYMGYAKGMNKREHQMRLYRGDAIVGADKPAGSKLTYGGYYKFNFGEGVILANVFNADDSWEIFVYEDGAEFPTGKMTKVSTKNTIKFYGNSDKEQEQQDYKWAGSFTKEDPRRIKDGVEAAYDMFVTGVHLNLNNTTSSARGWTLCSHLYKYTLKNPDAKQIKVVAKDRFGNVYEETKFTDYNDHTTALKP